MRRKDFPSLIWQRMVRSLGRTSRRRHRSLRRSQLERVEDRLAFFAPVDLEAAGIVTTSCAIQETAFLAQEDGVDQGVDEDVASDLVRRVPQLTDDPNFEGDEFVYTMVDPVPFDGDSLLPVDPILMDGGPLVSEEGVSELSLADVGGYGVIFLNFAEDGSIRGEADSKSVDIAVGTDGSLALGDMVLPAHLVVNSEGTALLAPGYVPTIYYFGGIDDPSGTPTDDGPIDGGDPISIDGEPIISEEGVSELALADVGGYGVIFLSFAEDGTIRGEADSKSVDVAVGTDGSLSIGETLLPAHLVLNAAGVTLLAPGYVPMLYYFGGPGPNPTDDPNVEGDEVVFYPYDPIPLDPTNLPELSDAPDTAISLENVAGHSVIFLAFGQDGSFYAQADGVEVRVTLEQDGSLKLGDEVLPAQWGIGEVGSPRLATMETAQQPTIGSDADTMISVKGIGSFETIFLAFGRDGSFYAQADGVEITVDLRADGSVVFGDTLLPVHWGVDESGVKRFAEGLVGSGDLIWNPLPIDDMPVISDDGVTELAIADFDKYGVVSLRITEDGLLVGEADSQPIDIAVSTNGSLYLNEALLPAHLVVSSQGDALLAAGYVPSGDPLDPAGIDEALA